jgi:hypothetical protein
MNSFKYVRAHTHRRHNSHLSRVWLKICKFSQNIEEEGEKKCHTNLSLLEKEVGGETREKIALLT